MTDAKPTPAPQVVVVMVMVAGVLGLATAFAVAGGTFTWGLPGATHIQSYHPDEQNITYSLRNMKPREFDFNPRFFGNPTFFTYQVGALAAVAGAAGLLPLEVGEDYWLAHPEAVRRFYILGRGLSAAYALGALALVVVLGYKVCGTARGGIYAGLFFATLPVTVIHGHYMTVNASGVFWSLAAMLFAVKIVDEPSWRNYIGAGVCAGLAISTKLNNAFLPLGILAAGLAAHGGQAAKRPVAARISAALGLCAAAFFAGSPYYVLSYASVAGDPHHRMNIEALFAFSGSWRTVLGGFWNHMSAACGWVFAGLLPAAVFLAVFTRNRRAVPLVAVAMPFLFLAAKSGWWAFPSRMWPALALGAVLLSAVLEGRTMAPVRIAAGLTAAVAILATMVWNAAYLELAAGEHIREESSRWIAEHIPAGEEIVVLDTPYFEEPDIVYENALHEGRLAPVKYRIANLEGKFDGLAGANAKWLVTGQRYDGILKARKAKGLFEYARENGFQIAATFQRRFEFFGWQLRDWVPADMVQNHPVYVFRRTQPVKEPPATSD